MSINISIVLQMVIFLLVILLLTQLLFRPFLELLKRREEAIQGSRRRAEELLAKATEMMARYQEGIAEARRRAFAARERLRAEALDFESRLIKETKEEVARTLEGLRSRIQAESQLAREALLNQAEAISTEIAEKLLGRRLDGDGTP